MDSQPDLPYEDIVRHASEGEVEHRDKIHELQKTLEKLKDDNQSAWETYGSELCAGDMIGQEKSIEEQIEELRCPK